VVKTPESEECLPMIRVKPSARLLGMMIFPAVAAIAAGGEPPILAVETPLGLPPLPVPKDNPMTAAKVELGRMIYFDKRLSKDGSISCATCHDPRTAWTEHRATSVGIHQQAGQRNAPTVINAAYLRSQFWDGRATSLEEQALGPIENPMEMGHALESCAEDLNRIPQYRKRFEEVFGTSVTAEGIARAIAAFERTVLSGNSPYDRYEAGDKKALTGAQQRGMEIFMNQGECSACHRPPLFTNGRFYNAGVGTDRKEPDQGRKAVTGKDGDFGRFRAPPLREVANTGPYFHDGSAERLEDAVRLMAGGGIDNPNLSEFLKSVREAKLTAKDIEDLVEFLKALSGEYPVVEPPPLP
jgi:cytochrome c peroxidase